MVDWFNNVDLYSQTEGTWCEISWRKCIGGNSGGSVGMYFQINLVQNRVKGGGGMNKEY